MVIVSGDTIPIFCATDIMLIVIQAIILGITNKLLQGRVEIMNGI